MNQAAYAGNLADRIIKDFDLIEIMGASDQWDAIFPDGDIYKSERVSNFYTFQQRQILS